MTGQEWDRFLEGLIGRPQDLQLPETGFCVAPFPWSEEKKLHKFSVTDRDAGWVVYRYRATPVHIKGEGGESWLWKTECQGFEPVVFY